MFRNQHFTHVCVTNNYILSRYRDPQLQMGENYSYLCGFSLPSARIGLLPIFEKTVNFGR